MRIRAAWLNGLIGVLGAGLIRIWRRTLTLRISSPMPELNPYDARFVPRQYIIASWHEAILAFAFFGLPELYKTLVLISRHQDGEYITRIVQRLGAHVARGSSKRGGRVGLLQMLRAGNHWHLAITPDGPRGPRRQFEVGAIFLASHTRLPIVPLGFGFAYAWRAQSWDRFALPLPFTAITCVVGAPIHVPRHLETSGLEHWRDLAERSLGSCTEAAQRWADGIETPPGPISMAA